MENRTLLLAFLGTWAVYLVAVHIWTFRKRLPLFGVLMSHVVPSITACLMTYVFLIAGGATVRQLAGSGSDLWSLWFHLWPNLLFATAVSVLVNLVWTVLAWVNETRQGWVPVGIAAVLMSVFAFITVCGNFPDA